jgi:hypothetical protein
MFALAQPHKYHYGRLSGVERFFLGGITKQQQKKKGSFVKNYFFREGKEAAEDHYLF